MVLRKWNFGAIIAQLRAKSRLLVGTGRKNLAESSAN
jgi:hypothetical protein